MYIELQNIWLYLDNTLDPHGPQDKHDPRWPTWLVFQIHPAGHKLSDEDDVAPDGQDTPEE